jgi:hypothetical protein
MKAYVSTVVDGKTRCGTEGNWITNSYKTRANLVRLGIRPYLKVGQLVKVELFRDWNNHFGQPDITFEVTGQ